MAKETFSWLTETTLEPIAVQPLEERKFPDLQNLKSRFSSHKWIIGSVLGLFSLLFILKAFRSKADESPPYRIESLAAVLPIAKGQIVEGMLLRPVLINPGSISKSQKLQILRPDDAEKIMGKIRAKKDIPPHKPVLWSDVELIPEQRTLLKPPIPKVVYPEDSQ